MANIGGWDSDFLIFFGISLFMFFFLWNSLEKNGKIRDEKVEIQNSQFEENKEYSIKMCKYYGKLKGLIYTSTNLEGEAPLKNERASCYFLNGSGKESSLSLIYIKSFLSEQTDLKLKLENDVSSKGEQVGKDTDFKEYKEFIKWKDSQIKIPQE